MAVAENERKMDMLKKENEECTESLHQIQIDSVDIAKQNPEIAVLDDEILSLNKELSVAQDDAKKCEIVSDQVYGWAKRVLEKMDG